MKIYSKEIRITKNHNHHGNNSRVDINKYKVIIVIRHSERSPNIVRYINYDYHTINFRLFLTFFIPIKYSEIDKLRWDEYQPSDLTEYGIWVIREKAIQKRLLFRN